MFFNFNFYLLPNLFNIVDPFLYQNSYFVSFMFFFISLIISILMVFIPYIMTGRSLKMNEVISEYECGFEPFDSATRQPFTVQFYIVGLLFLIFDVEITLVLPWSLIFSSLIYQSIIAMLIFLILLALGFLYEANTGVLNWGENNKAK